MYNLQFQQAHQTFQSYSRDHPDDPVGPASDAAAYLFEEFDRLGILKSQFLTDDSELLSTHKPAGDQSLARKFEEDLSKTDQLVAAALKKSPEDGNALFAKTIRLGLHADYEALVLKRSIAALSEVRQGRETAVKLLAAHSQYYDAYIAMGIENYLLSLKPAPVRWLLKATGAQTDHDTGIAELRKTAAHGRYLAPYAKVLLAIAALRDKKPAEARELLTWLANTYPGNSLYRDELAKLK